MYVGIKDSVRLVVVTHSGLVEETHFTGYMAEERAHAGLTAAEEKPWGAARRNVFGIVVGEGGGPLAHFFNDITYSIG